MLNKAVVMGRLTRDPEIKVLENELAKVLKFTIASDRARNSADSEKYTNFIDCVAWNKTAEFVAKYFHKGDAMIVEGNIVTRTYQDKQGSNRKAVEINAERIHFCTTKKAEKPDVEETQQDTDYSCDGDLPF